MEISLWMGWKYSSVKLHNEMRCQFLNAGQNKTMCIGVIAIMIPVCSTICKRTFLCKKG